MGERKSTPIPKKRQGSQDQAAQSKPWTLKEFSGKPVWDWLHLLSALAIPIVLAAAGLYFESQLDVRQRQFEKNQRAQQNELAERRAQEEALQAYLDQMSHLLLEKDLRASDKDSEVRILARARTLTVLGRLAPSRQGQVLQFLSEAGLLRQPVISLKNADLSGANLTGIDLHKADLSGLDLSGANLSGASFFGANLEEADLNQAEMGRTVLEGANLTHANLTDADLGLGASGDYLEEHKAEGFTGWPGTDLSGANLSFANLSGANLSGVKADFANLWSANLTDTNLRDAILSQAYMNNADLSSADLTDASLQSANLSDAKGITEEQLKQQVKALKGATMPDGSKHP